MVAKKIVFGDGEYIVSSSGIYTLARYYRHPATERRVVLPGMDHYGSPSYYAAVKRILAPCDLVLFEDIVPERLAGDRRKELVQRWLRELSSDSLDEAAVVAIWWSREHLYPLLRELPYEGDFFANEYRSSNWVNVDMLKEPQANVQKKERLREDIAAFPIEAKQSNVDYTRKMVQRILGGSFTTEDLFEDIHFRNSWCDQWQDFYVELDKSFQDPRDAHCFSEFDRLVDELNPRFVGIKFGASHMAPMRELLEERGYVYQRSKRLTVFTH